MPGKLDGKVAVVTGAGLGIGFIITERKQQPEMAEMVNATVQQIPMRRGGEPMDIAHLMLFLASAEAAYITGQSIVVDGGLTLGTVSSIGSLD